jgi:hypothetical protein
MENNQSPPVEKRTVILCEGCDVWKMGGVQTRKCDECLEKERNPFADVNWGSFWVVPGGKK